MMTLSKKINEKGVALIFFLLVFGVMLGFLMLVINTGILVYQKIRLQTAVDLAAYSAASVQASYLGNEASGDQSIMAINQKIQQRYGNLLNGLRSGYPAVWPQFFQEPISCMASCVAASLVNGNRVVSKYRAAVRDIQEYHRQIGNILLQLPNATKAAAEATLKLNIPDLDVGEGIAATFSSTTSNVSEIIGAQSGINERKNAVLSFSSGRGVYLANVAAPVPHSFPYFGPGCYDQFAGQIVSIRNFYCIVNGSGAGGGVQGWAMAAFAYARSYASSSNGNIGTVTQISDTNSNAIRLHFIPNTHNPDPFVVVSAEWYPENGSFMNMENSFGANGSLFPKKTRLVAVAAAEPFGGNLAGQDIRPFGVRLQSIRKLLLDPRMTPVRSDYSGLYDYMQFLGPQDETGEQGEAAEDVIRRFLH